MPHTAETVRSRAIESIEIDSERSERMSPAATGAVLDVATRQALIDAYEAMQRSSKRIDWHGILKSTGLTEEEFYVRANGYIEATESRAKARVAQAASNFLRWYVDGVTPDELTEEGVYSSPISAQTSLTRFARRIVEPDLPVAADPIDHIGLYRATGSIIATKQRRTPVSLDDIVEETQPVPPLPHFDGALLEEWFQPEPKDDSELAWQDDALCAQTDPEAFFPEKGGSTRQAKKICGGCEVRDECLQYALDNDERFGIWGGLSERERKKLTQRSGQVSA